MTAVCGSVLLHLIAVLVASLAVARNEEWIDPELFKKGESGVELTLLLPAQNTGDKFNSCVDEGNISLKRVEQSDNMESVNDADPYEKGVKTLSSVVAYVRPKYPLGARLRGEEGVVVVRAVLNENGTVESVTVLESSRYKALDDAATDALRKIRLSKEELRRLNSRELVQAVRFKLVD